MVSHCLHLTSASYRCNRPKADPEAAEVYMERRENVQNQLMLIVINDIRNNTSDLPKNKEV